MNSNKKFTQDLEAIQQILLFSELLKSHNVFNMRRFLLTKAIFYTILLQFRVLVEAESSQKVWREGSFIEKIGAAIPAGLLDSFFEGFENSSLSKDPCLFQLNLLVKSLEVGETWALKMVDASAKIPSGVLEGNMMLVGSYDECLKISFMEKLNHNTIAGKYCTTIVNNIEHQNKGELLDKDGIQDIRMTYGVCIPAVCTEEGLNELAKHLTKTLGVPFYFHFYEELCDFKDKNQLSVATSISLFFFASMGAICVASTLYDVLVFRNSDQKSSIWIAFSFYTNGRRLLSTRTSKQAVGCLNGLRVISMMFIILSHIYMYSMIQPLINPIDYAQKEEHTREGMKSLGSLAVDTFFVTGGFLVSYNYLLKNTDERKISFCKFYLHRFLRLTPSLAVVVLFYATIFSHIGSGPFWAFINYFFIDYCKENWWSTLLYVQNFVHPNNMCIGQSWYLAVDTQLYVLAPFLLYFVAKKPKWAVALLTLLILGSCGSTFGISWLEEVGPAVIGNTNRVMEYIYVATYTRATPWLMGFTLGLAMAKNKGHTDKLQQGTTYILRILPLPLMTGVIIYNDLRFTGRAITSVLEYSLYNALCRLLWSLGICIIIFLCDKGYGGAVNRFLSHSIFSVLIKLNYSTYLLHILIIMFLNGQVRASHYAASYLNVFQFCGTYTITTAISVVWTLAFESPIVILEKSLMKGN